MMVEAFILSWNEELLPLTIKHYQQFCDSITIYDNYSSDGSDQIAAQMGCRVERFGRPGVLSDASYLKVKNTCWKGSKADWVIVCDADEILYHKDLKQILQDEKEASIFQTQGYNIYSHDLPKDSYFEIKTGLADNSYSKNIIFKPNRIADIRYSYGAHKCDPSGDITFSEQTLYLLHYRCLGGPQRIVRRHQRYRSRMSDDNKRLGLGVHYTYDDQRRVREWHEYYERCQELSELGILF